MINCIDHIGPEKYEIYGTIGFRRYEHVSKKEAQKRYLMEALVELDDIGDLLDYMDREGF